MPNILSLETSTDACSAALLTASGCIERFQLAPRQHSELILDMVNSLLNQSRLTLNEIDAIAYGAGPGSFIGVRLCASVTQGLAFGANLSVIAVSSLQALALAAREKSHTELPILAGWDARMQEVYWNCYSAETMNSNSVDTLSKPEAIEIETDCVLVGNAWQVYSDQLSASVKNHGKIIFTEALYPSARHVAELALAKYQLNQFVNIAAALPNYVRNDVAHKAK